MREIVPFDKIEEEGYGRIICYPRSDPDEFSRRLMEMKALGVKALCFTGEKNVNNMPVLGKGCVGIVVLAYTNVGRVALKIRRTDVEKYRIEHEAEMLRIANSVDVGPELLGHSENLLMMEFISGTLLPKWVENIKVSGDTCARVRRVLGEILEQSWRLDEVGLDHGELSRSPKHVIIDVDDRAYLLDFETASIMRRVSNVTSICQYLFISGRVAGLIRGMLRVIKRRDLIAVLRAYKRDRNRENFERILEACLLL